VARVSFTPILKRHLDVETTDAAGDTVRGVLDSIFAANPRLKRYVLEDHGGLRKHVQVFLNGEMVADRRHLTDAAGENDDLYVMQALSGG
jgi:sulfur-carrier protein